MKIGLIADLHLGYYPTFLSGVLDRHAEQIYLDKVFQRFADEGVELIAVLGDLLHTWRGRSGWMALMHFLGLIRRYRIPTFMVRGNHDVIVPQLYDELSNISDGYFFTFVGMQSLEKKSPILATDELHEGIAYEKVMELHDIRHVAVLPHAASILPEGVISEMRENTMDMFNKENAILFVHYFLESRLSSLLSNVMAREFVVPDNPLAQNGTVIFAGHDHRRYVSRDGRYVIGSMLPRDARLGGDDVSFGIAEITSDNISYTPLSISLPYRLEYKRQFDTLEQAVDWIKTVLEEKELLVISHLGISEKDITLVDVEKHLAAYGVDVGRVNIRRLVSIIKREKDGHIVELDGVAGVSIDDAFQQYFETHKSDITLPDGIDEKMFKDTMGDIFASLLRGDVDD